MDEIIKKIESLGYSYKVEYYSDGEPMAYKFIRPDCMQENCYWEVSIEDHRDDDGEDWLIFFRYHDPENKDWFGHQADEPGVIEYRVMRLIMEFINKLIEVKGE